MREKLIELLYDAMFFEGYGRELCEQQADYLIANGVTISKKETVATDNNKWIPVTERLPEKEMEVIVYTGNILKPSVHCYHFWTADLLSWQSVTHWMPLPEPPKGE